MPSPSLDPLTGPDPSTLTAGLLAERLASERALREQAMAYIEKALELQAIEYERRLDALNGEAGRLAKVLDATIPREVYEAFVKTNADKFRTAIDALEVQIETERSARIRSEGSLSTWRFLATFLGLTGLVGVVLGIISVFGQA